MTGTRDTRRGPRWVAWVVLVVAGALLIGSVAWTALSWNRWTSDDGWVYGPAYSRTRDRADNLPGRGMGGGTGGTMMGGQVWLAGDGNAVDTIDQARARADEAGSSQRLTAGEVMQFSENFYVEMVDSADQSVTEVLVDPADGTVTTEYGPAMMWNTGSRDATVSADEAKSIADEWLRAYRPGETTASDVLSLPGYYTIDTTNSDTVVSMLSVNAQTGAVWYHSWHGDFIAEEDD